MKTSLKTVIVIMLLIMSSCQTIPESQGTIKINFCSIKNCTKIMIEEIKNSENIRCAFYSMDNKGLIKTLEEHDASIIIDEDEKTDLKAHKRIGKGLMHNKFCVIDNKKVITGSYNPTDSASDDYNNMMIIESRPIAEFYNNIHEQILTGKRKRSKNNKFLHNNISIEIYTCPKDDCKKEVMKELKETKEEIILALFTFTDKDIANLIISMEERNVSVTGIIESFQQPKYNQYFPLKRSGAGVILETTDRLQHNKIFIIDNRTVITGSYNPTRAANTINDENILIIHDEEIASAYAKYIKEYLMGKKDHLKIS